LLLKIQNMTKPQIHRWGVQKIILWSRSFSKLTRRFKPPTTNGHAPPPKKSRKHIQTVNPSPVRTWYVSPRCVKLIRKFHFLCATPSISLSSDLATILPLESNHLTISLHSTSAVIHNPHSQHINKRHVSKKREDYTLPTWKKEREWTLPPPHMEKN